MKSVTIRKVPEPVHRAWRVRAEKNGRSLEAELRAMMQILARPRKQDAKTRGPLPSSHDEINLTTEYIHSDHRESIRKVREILHDGRQNEIAATK